MSEERKNEGWLLEAELKDAAEQQRKFAEWAKSLPEGIEPTAAEFEQTARINSAWRQMNQQEQDARVQAQPQQQLHALQFTIDQIDRIRFLFSDTQKAGTADPKLEHADRDIVQKLDHAAIRARYQPSDDEVAKSSEDLAQRASLRLRF